MAYSSTNPIRRMTEAGLADGVACWMYRSTHSHAEVEAAGFFADGRRAGLKLGDALLNLCHTTTGSSAATWHVVSASTGAVAASSTAGSSAWDQAFNVSVSAATT